MKMLRAMVLGALVATLAACGGGGGSAGTVSFGGTAPAASSSASAASSAASATMSVSVSNITVTSAAPVTVTAMVKDATGAGVAGQVVAFATSGGLGTFSASTALTDSTGTATVSLTPTSSSTRGADTVVATSTVAGASVSAQVSFQLSATTVTISTFKSDVSSLSAYGQSTLTVVLSGTTASTPVTVTVASACVSASPTKATLTPASVTTTTGTATFTYRDQGCGATSLTDTLQASVSGTASVAPLGIALTSPTVSSVTFVSASSSTIYLKGSGLNETSEVTFQIRDTAGNGLPNQSVMLTPTTLTGGLTLDGGSAVVTKVSDSNGNVLVRINSGTVPTPVRVKAALVSDVSVQTVSSNLSIAVGLPSQNNFSLSQTTANIEGFNRDGTVNTYQIILSDRLANPVPDGTAVNFIATSGQVIAQAFTSGQAGGGFSSVRNNFLSADPRPDDGRITVLAYALGEESFLDANGNNIYDAGEDFQELGNMFLDRDFDGVYDIGIDQPISLSINSNGACRAGTSSLLALDVSEPTIAGTCDGVWGQAYVRRAVQTVLSTSAARPLWYQPPINLFDVNITACNAGVVNLRTSSASTTTGYHAFGTGGYFNAGASGVITLVVADANEVRLNPMAAGTVVSATGSTGITATVNGGSPVPSSLIRTFASIGYTFATGTTSGTLDVTFTSPSGLATTVPLFISQSAAPINYAQCTQ